MQARLRQIHLGCAFMLTVFVTMYFVTGYVITRSAWFPDSEPQVAVRTAVLDPASKPGGPGEASYVAWLQDQCDIRGQRRPGRRNGDGSWRFDFVRPGHLTRVRLAADFHSAEIREERPGWKQTLVGFHRLHGYGHGRLYDAWAVVFDLSSGAMIVFAITGLLLWHRLVKDHRPGWILLAAGGLLTVGFALGFHLSR
ncbi:MAG: PepSY-associated TM helix domain-containing protein [Verrucomicrobia bacterium]|nr:PepSY-associated TM helix domain-containing protein [Verrucomicrobiota bacterium]